MTARIFTDLDAGHWGLGLELGLRQTVLGYRMIALRLGYWWVGLRWAEADWRHPPGRDG